MIYFPVASPPPNVSKGKMVPIGHYDQMIPGSELCTGAALVARLIDNMPWLGELVGAMNTLGWDVYSLDHEDGIGQFEIDFAHADALTMANRFVFFRWMAHEIARKHGAFATFMPEPYADRARAGPIGPAVSHEEDEPLMMARREPPARRDVSA